MKNLKLKERAEDKCKGWQIVRCPNGVGLWELTHNGDWTGETFDSREEAEQAIRHYENKELMSGRKRKNSELLKKIEEWLINEVYDGVEVKVQKDGEVTSNNTDDIIYGRVECAKNLLKQMAKWKDE